jgi:hypothetical protein
MVAAVSIQHLAEHEVALIPERALVHPYRLENAVGVMPFGLTGGAAIETPHRDVVETSIKRIGVDHLTFGSDVGGGPIAIQPNIIESIL